MYPYPSPYTYSFLDPFWGVDDNFVYDGTSSYAPQDASTYAGQPGAYAGQAPDPYAGQAPDPYAGQAPDPYAGQPAEGYGPEPANDGGPLIYAPYAYPSQPQVMIIQAPPSELQEDAITVFFKDSRPPEQIRNYVLTRSTLLITGQHMREIPLGEIDLVTTERVNRAMGVDFRLPQPN